MTSPNIGCVSYSNENPTASHAAVVTFPKKHFNLKPSAVTLNKRPEGLKVRVILQFKPVGKRDDLNIRIVRFLSYIDLVSSYFFLVLCTLSMLSEWRYFGVKWPHVNDPLSNLLYSAFPKQCNRLDLSLDPTTLNWAMAGQIAILTIYMFRMLASFNLVRAMTLNLGLCTKCYLCTKWIIVGALLIGINASALICSNLGICFRILLLAEVIFRIVAFIQVVEVMGYFKRRLEAEDTLNMVAQKVNGRESKGQRPHEKLIQPSVIYTDAFAKAEEKVKAMEPLVQTV